MKLAIFYICYINLKQILSMGGLNIMFQYFIKQTTGIIKSLSDHQNSFISENILSSQYTAKYSYQTRCTYMLINQIIQAHNNVGLGWIFLFCCSLKGQIVILSINIHFRNCLFGRIFQRKNRLLKQRCPGGRRRRCRAGGRPVYLLG